MTNEEVIVYCEEATDCLEEAIKKSERAMEAMQEVRAYFVNLGD
jgi:hypothetical protein